MTFHSYSIKLSAFRLRAHTVEIIIIVIIITIIIIGATETISKSFRKYVSNTPRKHEDKEHQKTVILGTAHILRKVGM